MVCNFSNTAFSIFGYPIHWYSLAYICGIMLALKLTEKLAVSSGSYIKRGELEEFITAAIIGIILGGRLGHVLFYDFHYYINNPIEIAKVWKGGMSFFGGFCGVVCSTIVFCKNRKIDFLNFIDLWSVSVPIGLFLGRIANLINRELLGKPADIAWGVVFADGIIRHPSQIYEAILEGCVLFAVMLTAFSYSLFEKKGALSGVFCCGYGICRFIAEFFREPDSAFSYQLLYNTGINLNQYMSMIMFIIGSVLICRCFIHAK